jgi:integrase
MAVRKRNVRWWYDFTVKGVRYRGPLPEARTRRTAEELEDKIKVSVYDGTYNQPKARTLGDFIDQTFWPWAKANYRTPNLSHRFHVQIVKKRFGYMHLRDISPMIVEKFKRERLAEPTKWKVSGGVRKPATVNRDLQMLSRILSMAKDYGLIRENPCSKVKLLRQDNQRTRYINEEEEEMLLNRMRHDYPSLVPIFIFAMNTGMRRGEITKLTWADVDLQRGLIFVRDTKTAKPRQIPINAEAEKVLIEMKERNSEKVFPITNQTVSDHFHNLVKKLSLDDLRFHDIRHSFATRLADAGVDPFTIAEILGHSNLNMTKRYTHSLESNKRRAVALLEGSGHKSVTSLAEKRQKTG